MNRLLARKRFESLIQALELRRDRTAARRGRPVAHAPPYGTPEGRRRGAFPFVELYTAWDKADPGKGYDAKANEWKARLAALPPATPATTPTSRP